MAPATSDAPLVGAVYGFKTKPLFRSSKRDTGRFAAFKIILVTADLVAVAVLDGVWPELPSSHDVQALDVLREHRFSHTGREAVLGINRSWWSLEALDEAAFICLSPLTSTEQEAANRYAIQAMGCSYGTLHSVNSSSEGEWRWANEREDVTAEQQATMVAEQIERASREERYQARLKGLTFETLLAETPFERWEPSPPFPPEDFTSAARARIHETCREVRALGEKPGKPAVRAALKRCMIWFNAEDEKAGHVIETEEREDICGVLEEIAHAARQPALVHEIDDWREW